MSQVCAGVWFWEAKHKQVWSLVHFLRITSGNGRGGGGGKSGRIKRRK